MSHGQVRDKYPSCSLDKGGTERPKERCRQRPTSCSRGSTQSRADELSPDKCPPHRLLSSHVPWGLCRLGLGSP